MNKWYVYYDSNFNIISVTNELRQQGSYFEVEQSAVQGFISGTKNIASFKVKINNLNEFIIDDADIAPTELIFKDIDFAYSNVEEPNLIIRHLDKWIFSLSTDLKNKIPKTQYNTRLYFYIANKYELNMLYRTIELTVADLIAADCTFDFVTDYEHCLDQLTVITKKNFDKICLTS